MTRTSRVDGIERQAAAVALVVLVVLAGCSGILDGDSQKTATLTPAAVPTDQPTPTPAPRLAPGLTAARVENASALAAAHDATLDGTSFTVRETTVYRAANGTTIRRVTSTTRVGGDGRVSVTRRWNGATTLRRSASYFDGTRRLVATTRDGETTYRRTPATATEPIAAGTGRKRIARTFTVAEVHVADRIESRETTAYRLVPDERPSATPGRSVRVHATVTARGLVRNYTLDQRLSGRADDVSSIHVSTRYAAIDSTAVERPAWYEQAMAETNTTVDAATRRMSHSGSQ